MNDMGYVILFTRYYIICILYCIHKISVMANENILFSNVVGHSYFSKF